MVPTYVEQIAALRIGEKIPDLVLILDLLYEIFIDLCKFCNATLGDFNCYILSYVVLYKDI